MSSGPTVVPMIPGVPARTLISLALAMASDSGRVVALSVVEVPEDRSLSEAVPLARRRREVLRRIGEDVDSPTSVEFVVRAARSFEEGVRETVLEHKAANLLLGWRGPLRFDARIRRSNLEPLILRPPCDLMLFRVARPAAPAGQVEAEDGNDHSPDWPPRSILVPIRGGPHAELAVSIGEMLGRSFPADVTVMVVDSPPPSALVEGGEAEFAIDGTTAESDGDDASALLAQPISAPVVSITAESVADAIAEESSARDLLILGASARGPRSTYLFGRLPEEVADRIHGNVMIVKTAEPLSPEMFGVTLSPPRISVATTKASISTVVDQWFGENTFHSHEFDNLATLVRLKERQGVSISVALPALNEEATVGKIITTIQQRLVNDYPLVDELMVIDSNSEDRTVEIATELGVPVYRHSEILTDQGTHVGKGEGLWKSLHVTRGDIVVWVDSDITDIHPKFVYGLVGPLLTQPGIEFVKGYYRRPLNLGTEMLTTGGGRVTELMARPMINLFYPQLSGLVQPLAGEMAGRRSLLERLPFFTGYGVETGLLIDILERAGLGVLAQTDLENRIHRNQDMISLSKMAFAIVQVVMRRLEDRSHIELLEEINTTMKLIHYSPEELFLEVQEIREHERPPIIEVPEYVEVHKRAEATV